MAKQSREIRKLMNMQSRGEELSPKQEARLSKNFRPVASDLGTSPKQEAPIVWYEVVTRTNAPGSDYDGVITRTSYRSKAHFDAAQKETMRDGSGRLVGDVYHVVAEGITEEEAAAIIESPMSHQATMLSFARQINSSARNAATAFNSALDELIEGLDPVSAQRVRDLGATLTGLEGSGERYVEALQERFPAFDRS